MKRILALVLSLLPLMAFAACGNNYKSRTAEFYGSIDKSSFWYRGTVTSGDTVYTYTQAIDGDSVTTIEDHENDSEDGYVIYEGNLLHSLYLSSKKYDTLQTDNGVDFLFGNNEYKEFNYPDYTSDAGIFEGSTYYCEVFTTVDDQGNEAGENKYYYSEDRLVAIEWYEDGKLEATLKMEDYSGTIPEDIYVSLPEDFKAGTYTAETVVDYSELWGE